MAPNVSPTSPNKIDWSFGAMANSERSASVIEDTTAPADTSRTAAETRTKQLQKADVLDLEHAQPDRSVIRHDFGNGYTIRELQTLGDLRREGELMSNCFRPQCHEGLPETINTEYHPYLEPGDYSQDKVNPRLWRADLGRIPWYQPISEKGRYFSLRDSDNLPHVSIDHGQGGYGAVQGKHNEIPKPEHQSMVDDWETKEFGEPIEGFDVENPSWKPNRVASVNNELHIGLEIPAQAAAEINQWVHSEDWPKGTKFLEPDEYHVTLLFCKGGNAGKHLDDDWTHKRHAISVTGLREFPQSKDSEYDGLYPVVLLVKGDTLREHHELLCDEAEDKGLDAGPYTHSKYKPHITIAYTPDEQVAIKSPTKMTFETATSTVSKPRETEDKVSKIGTYYDEIVKIAMEKVATDSWKSRDKWPDPESDLNPDLETAEERRTDSPQAPPVGKGQPDSEAESWHLTIKQPDEPEARTWRTVAVYEPASYARDPRPRDELERLIAQYRQMKDSIVMRMTIRGLEDELRERDRNSMDDTWRLATEHGNSDSRRYQDDHMLAPHGMPAPNATDGIGSEPEGCTCGEEHKLDCPVHGLHPTQLDPGLEWSVTEGSPVGWHQNEMGYTKGGHEASLWNLPTNAINRLKGLVNPSYSDEDREAFLERRNQTPTEPFPATWWSGQPAIVQQQDESTQR